MLAISSQNTMVHVYFNPKQKSLSFSSECEGWHVTSLQGSPINRRFLLPPIHFGFQSRTRLNISQLLHHHTPLVLRYFFYFLPRLTTISETFGLFFIFLLIYLYWKNIYNCFDFITNFNLNFKFTMERVFPNFSNGVCPTISWLNHIVDFFSANYKK